MSPATVDADREAKWHYQKSRPKPLVRCSSCGHDRNSLTVHLTEDGQRVCIACLHPEPMTRTAWL